eukprot:gene13659-19546_t
MSLSSRPMVQLSTGVRVRRNVTAHGYIRPPFVSNPDTQVAPAERLLSKETITGSRRAVLSACVAAFAAKPLAAFAEEVGTAARVDIPETVYFGNGCFWGRQKAFVDAEMKLGRTTPDQVTSVVGYAGGTRTGIRICPGPGGKVCYFYGDPRAVYEGLGHAEVVQVKLTKQDVARAQTEFRTFADEYFIQFQKTPQGMMRLDPQDAGPGYRNVVGLPGGIRSPLYKVLQDANVNGMELREGRGNEFEGMKAREDDLLNVVWIIDSDALPFNQAEMYHQFHSGINCFLVFVFFLDFLAPAGALAR